MKRSKLFLAGFVTAGALLLLILVFSLFAGLFSSVDAIDTAVFPDVEGTHWSYPVNFLYENGVVHGYSDGRYHPYFRVNRAEFLKTALEIHYDTFPGVTEGGCGFSDVSFDAWYAPYACFAKANGFDDGFADGTFRPGDFIDFVDALTIMAKLCSWETASGASGNWKAIVDEAARRDVIPLSIRRLDQKLNRGIMAQLITRFMKEKQGELLTYRDQVGALDERVTYECLRRRACPVADTVSPTAFAAARAAADEAAGTATEPAPESLHTAAEDSGFSLKDFFTLLNAKNKPEALSSTASVGGVPSTYGRGTITADNEETSVPVEEPAPEEESGPVGTPILQETPAPTPEAPSYFNLSDEEKLALLPPCDGLQFTVPPAPLADVTEIYPRGGINPPMGHIIPTDHMYIHIDKQGQNSRLVPLAAPGDIYLLTVTSTDPNQSPVEYSAQFALCRDVFGYFGHIKALSSELQSVIADVSCAAWSSNPDNVCQKSVFEPLEAGTVIGQVGDTQGNFDFGVYDYRSPNAFINPARYGSDNGGLWRPRTPYIQCPFDYYESSVRGQLYDKVLRQEAPRCGRVMQDIPGTLAGNWFAQGGDMGNLSNWSQELAFIENNRQPSEFFVVIGGGFTSVGQWAFTPVHEGRINRAFDEVTSDGNAYCYESAYQSGRLIVQMTDNSTLNIERQEGACADAETFTFSAPAVYER